MEQSNVDKGGACLLFCIILCLFMLIYIGNTFTVDDASLKKGELDYFPELWQESVVEENGLYKVSMENVVPDEDLHEISLFLKSYHQALQVFIDGECIYEYGTNVSVTFGNSVASSYHVIPLHSSYAGKNIQLYLESVYHKKGKVIPKVMIGNERMIFYQIIREKGGLIIEAVAMFVLALGLIFFWAGSRRAVYASNSFLYLGLTVFALTVWFLTDSQVLGLFFNNTTINMYLCYLSFFSIPIPMVLYFREMIGQGYQRAFKMLEIVSLSYFLIAYISQFLNLADFKQLIPGIHIIFFVCLIFFLYVGIDRRRKGDTKIIFRKQSLASALFCSAMMVIDFFRYYLNSGDDVSRFTRIGGVIYVLGLVISMILDSFESQALASEAAIYEKLAYSDKLTGIFNRTAFESVVKEMDTELTERGKLSESVVVICFDLNHLKQINDTQGHAQGDQYIKTFASLLKSIFREYGNAYRTGGDEFIVILNQISNLDANVLVSKLQNRIEAYNIDHQNQWKGLSLSTAYGIAEYQFGVDQKIQNIIERADQLMYQNKAEQKEKMKQAEANK